MLLPCLLPLLVFPPQVSDPCEVARLTADGVASFLATGKLAGDRIFLASGYDQVHVFERTSSGWVESLRRTIPGEFVFDQVDIGARSELFAAGIEEEEERAGRVLVYEARDGWRRATELVRDSEEEGDGFGSGFAIEGDVVVAGAAQEIYGLRFGPGKAYVFERSGSAWFERARLDPHGSTGWETGFGRTLDLHGTTIVIGSPGDDELAHFWMPGAVYLYEKQSAGWMETAKLFASDANPTGGFGRKVALSGDTLLVSSANPRQVYCFRRTVHGWSEEQTLAPSGLVEGDDFGAALDVDGELAVIGAPGVDSGDRYDVGAIFVYRRSGGLWELEHELVAEGVPTGSRYGRALSLDGNRVLWWGAFGPAYLSAIGIAWSESYCAPGQNSTGIPATIHVDGCDSVAGNSLRAGARNLPPGALAVPLLGKVHAQAAFGNGFLCLAQPFSRLAPARADAGGAVAVTLDFTGAPGDRIAPGSTWSLQWIFRDPGYGAGFGSTDGIAVALAP